MWKRRMNMKMEGEYLGPDRLSSLPDVLLIHIFSFLDTKNAIQACFSLKKWLSLWTLLPDLHFTTSVFKNLSSFHKFVDKVLNLHDDSIVKINNFKYDRSLLPKQTEIAESTLERMFSFIVSHEVKQLTFSVERPSPLDPLGSCAALTSLKLGLLVLDRTLCLNQVVTLYLEGVLLTRQETFSGCPNLKNLTLINCLSGRCSTIISVVAPQLSMLTITTKFSHAAKVMLSTPRLTALKIRIGSVPLLQSDDLLVLDTVDVIVDMRPFTQSKNLQQFSKLISMLKCFHNAKSVTLSSDTIKILSMFPDELEKEPSPFCNLKLLNITPSAWCTAIAIPGQAMTYLLGKSPHASTVVGLSRYV